MSRYENEHSERFKNDVLAVIAKHSYENIFVVIRTHSQASFLGTDILMNPERIPPLVKDYYWDKQDCPIPYTEAAIQFKRKTYRGSADDMK